jgi:hypothetical protein
MIAKDHALCLLKRSVAQLAGPLQNSFQNEFFELALYTNNLTKSGHIKLQTPPSNLSLD